MDEAAIDALGAEPLKPELAKIVAKLEPVFGIAGFGAGGVSWLLVSRFQ